LSGDYNTHGNTVNTHVMGTLWCWSCTL